MQYVLKFVFWDGNILSYRGCKMGKSKFFKWNKHRKFSYNLLFDCQMRLFDDAKNVTWHFSEQSSAQQIECILHILVYRKNPTFDKKRKKEILMLCLYLISILFINEAWNFTMWNVVIKHFLINSKFSFSKFIEPNSTNYNVTMKLFPTFIACMCNKD